MTALTPAVRLLVPLDRLDGRRHTFGTFITGWLEALRPSLSGLTIIRKRRKSTPALEGWPQAELPAALEGDRAYGLLFPLWARRFGANIIHFPYRYAPYGWWGLPARKVVTVHDTALISLSSDLVSRMKGRTVWRYRRSLARFDAVVTVSEASKGELVRNFGLPPGRIRVIPHGVGERFRPGPAELDLAALYGVRRPYILNVSSIKRKKNIPGLLRAFARLVREGYPHSLVLVGKPDDGLDEVLDEAARLGLEQRVVMTGFVDAGHHPEFYRQADVLVYPSFYEGFGMPILEAMASACPVVAAGVSSMPEVAGDAALLVDPKSDEDIHRAIRSILDDAAVRRRLVELGLERARAFTWRKSAAAHMELYRDLLRDGPEGI